jgi:hypothetical protein
MSMHQETLPAGEQPDQRKIPSMKTKYLIAQPTATYKAGDRLIDATIWRPADVGSGYTETSQKVSGTISKVREVRAYGCSFRWAEAEVEVTVPE